MPAMIVYKQLVYVSMKQSLYRGRIMKRRMLVFSAAALIVAAAYCSAQTGASKSKAKPRRAGVAAAAPVAEIVLEGSSPNGRACVGNTSQIVAEHGTVWGHESKIIVGELTHSIYDKLIDYYTCVGLAQRNGDACNRVPYFINLKQGYDDEETPRSRCHNNLVKLLYLTGKESVTFCRENLHMMDMTGEVFCNNVKDLPEACGKASKLMHLPAVPPECYVAFPRTQADCGSDNRCRKIAKLNMAIKTNSGEGLSPFERASFDAYQTKTTSSCKVILNDLASSYCKARNTYYQVQAASPDAQKGAAVPSAAANAVNQQKAVRSSDSLPPPSAPVLCTTCQVYRDQMTGQKKAATKDAKPAVKK